MSWQISLIENSAFVPEAARGVAADCLFDHTDRFWELDFETVPQAMRILHAFDDSGRIIFDSDDMEHMDYVTENDKVCSVLAAVGVTGSIKFGSLEGDNRNSFWGVEFASGHYRRLTATTANLQWNVGTSYAGQIGASA